MPQVARRRPAARSAGYSADTDEDRQLPRARRGRSAEPDDDDRDDTAATQLRGRRRDRSVSRDDDDQDAAPPARSRRGDRDKPAPSSGGRGWASHRKNESKTKRGFGTSPDEFTVAETDTTYLVKLLEDEPFWSYLEHFVNEIEEGKRSFTCGGDQCPLCDYGHGPRAFDLFNVAVWDPAGDNGEGQWAAKYWRATPDPAGKILTRAEELGQGRNPRALGHPDIYLAVSKTASKKKKGGRSFNEFKIDIVKERDLEDDYEAFPLTDEDLEEFDGKLFDETVVPEASLKELRDAAEALDE